MIAFVCGGGKGVGWGHVARCIRLAEALRRRGRRSVFLARDAEREPKAFLRASRFPCRSFHGDPLRALARLRGRVSVLVVDDYAAGQAFFRRCRSAFPGVPIVAIDDLGRDLSVDLLVEPCPEPKRHRCTGPVLSGHRFTLAVRAPFVRSRPGGRTRVLVSLGGNSGRIARKVLKALESCRLPLEAWVTGDGAHLSSASSGHLRTRRIPPGWDFWRRIPKPAFAICAGGGTCLEAACRGVPLLLIERAANQHDNIQALVRIGAARLVGPTSSASVARIRAVVRAIFSDAPARRAMSAAGQRRIDGKGAERAASAVVRMMESRGRAAALRSPPLRKPLSGSMFIL